MNLKKSLRSRKSQAIAEYLLLFVIVCAAVVAVFGCLNPEGLSIGLIFNQAIESAFTRINQ